MRGPTTNRAASSARRQAENLNKHCWGRGFVSLVRLPQDTHAARPNTQTNIVGGRGIFFLRLPPHTPPPGLTHKLTFLGAGVFFFLLPPPHTRPGLTPTLTC